MSETMQHAKCHNVNDHGIHASILVIDGPSGSLGADVSHEACLDVVTQVGRQSNLSGPLIHKSGANISTCIRSRTSALTVVPVDHSCPALTTTEATGLRPMLSLTLIRIPAKLDVKASGLQIHRWSLEPGKSRRAWQGG